MQLNKNYVKAHESKNRGQHVYAAGCLKKAAIELGLDLAWTGDAITDWDSNLGAVDAALNCKDSPWKLLHEQQPEDGDECFFGFKMRNEIAVISVGRWHVDSRGEGFCTDLDGRDIFADFLPVYLPFDIYWCDSDAFDNPKAALKSLEILLGVSV